MRHRLQGLCPLAPPPMTWEGVGVGEKSSRGGLQARVPGEKAEAPRRQTKGKGEIIERGTYIHPDRQGGVRGVGV